MANPKNPGYVLALKATDDPDVVRVTESDDVEGPAPARNVSAAEAAKLAYAWAASGPTEKKAAPAKKAAAKPAVYKPTPKKKPARG
jgi:hypothetical protein